MGGGKRACDSCKVAVSALFCNTDSAFLCLSCDASIHAQLVHGHERVWLCDVCEQAPACVTCKADSAALCATCDRDIHSANPLARRHDRIPVVPFYESPTKDGGDNDYLSDSEEAASWLLPDPKDELKPSEYVFSDDMVPYLGLDLMTGDQKPSPSSQQPYVPIAADGVVPVVGGKIGNNDTGIMKSFSTCAAPSMVEGVPCYDDMDYNGSKPYLVYNFNSQSITQSLSSSSLEVGVVPEHNTMADVSTNSLPNGSSGHETVALTGIDREARVMRYREKRKNRKFEKTIRYASRKAYAETRPRIKGRFAKRTEQLVDLDGIYNSSPTLVTDTGYVVPSF